MDKGSHPNPRKNGIPKEVFKDLSLVRPGNGIGRDSPESGSLYSDYESGQQYEDKDLPSGYNSGEQYDTMSTGYMSGEAYELPEARELPMEVKLSSIEEHSLSNRSSEDLFTLTHTQVSPESNLLVQTEIMESDSSSSIPEQGDQQQLVTQLESMTGHKMKRKKKDHPVVVPENSILLQTEILESSSSSSIPKNMELTSVLDPINLHKLKIGKKLGKKSVSYHVSVPIEKSPLGHEVKVKIPRSVVRDPNSDTDTTSCFDSDGTYMRSEGQSSDSGAVLLHSKKSRRNRSKDREMGGESGIISGNRKRIRKAKQIIRNSSDFFDRYDNKYWAVARQICFWASTLSVMACIVGAGFLILMMPRTCDPEVEWWQGEVTVDIFPRNGTDGNPPTIHIAELIQNIPRYLAVGVQTLKLKHIYLTNPDRQMNSSNPSNWETLSTEVVQSRIDEPDMLGTLAKELHEVDMTLMVEIPAMQGNSTGRMDYQLERSIMTAIVYWAERGVDGISMVGLDLFSADPFLPGNIKTWRSKFEQYGTSPNTKILCGPFLLPHNIEAISPAVEGEESDSPAFTGIASLGLLDATVSLGTAELNQGIGDAVSAATKWDLAPSQPWIQWALQGAHTHLTNAEMAFLMFLPGSVSMQGLRHQDEDLVKRLITIRKTAVPVFMNGNYKSCRSHCTSYKEKEENYLVHILGNGIILMERNFSRRNRYMVIANMGAANVSLSHVSHLYTGGERILDTHNLNREVDYVNFKDAELSGMQAYVIKFPK